MELREIATAGLGGAVATAVDVSTLVLQVRHGTPIPLAAFIARTSTSRFATLQRSRGASSLGSAWSLA